MAISFRRFLHASIIVLAAFLAVAPLRAQLDPRLQAGNTDLLDLYQQSTNTKVKPEIVTIFDFSGSMQALMYHPLFVNTDSSDSQSSTNMTFGLSNVLTGPTNTYRVTATAVQNTGTYATVDVTVGGGASNASTTRGVDYGPVVIGGRNRYLRTTISNITWTPVGFSAGVTYTFSATVTNSVVDSRGNATTSVWPNSLSTAVTWSIQGPNPISSAGVWVAPAQNPAQVTVTKAVATIQGTAVGTLTSKDLIKPDGTVVTATDAAAVSSSLNLYGVSFGSGDVRNWVRAASHARFEYNDGGTLRTLDIPIAWKIMDRNSTGSPLSSLTVWDHYERTNPNGSTTVIGSNQQIEMDSLNNLSYGSYVLSGTNPSDRGGSTQQTTTTLSRVDYKKFYVDWLFKGKYTVGTYTGKYIVFDAANPSLAGGQGSVNWGQGFGNMSTGDTMLRPVYDLDGNYLNRETTVAATLHAIPALNRVQAVKRAAISTWVRYQDEVMWAFRFLEPTGEANGGNATDINNNSRTNLSTGDPTATAKTGSDSGWRLMNSDSVGNMKRIAHLLDSGNTPLTYATARALAQFTDPNSVFNDKETGADAPSQCMNHFLILFTDGIDNNGSGTNNPNGDSPYLTGSGATFALDALTGNRAIIGSPTSVDRYGTYWNLFTFCGIAAHLADPALGTVNVDHLLPQDPGTSTKSGVPSSFLPFALYKRGSVQFDKPHLVTTMTVGVGLGGKYTDSDSPKRNLFMAAAIGDPSLTSYQISLLEPFQWVPDPNEPGQYKKKDGSIYFFDANDPDKLKSDLEHAIASAVGPSNTNTTSNPNLPYIGASLGKQVYLGKFRPPTNGGVIWNGDLMMFGTKQVGSETKILDRDGSTTTDISPTTAVWSAADALFSARIWSARKLFTRIPGTSATPENGLTLFSDTGTVFSDSTKGLKNFVAKSLATDALKQSVIQFAAGGDTAGAKDTNGRPTTNRTSIMGDIINSSPSALEYKFSDVSAYLTPRLAAAVSHADGVINRFRLILVGTNQGWLHAFGEVTNITKATSGPNVGQDIVKGDVDELWSFMPTDFLANLNYLTVTNNPHRFLVDGTPSIYFLDLPPATGGLGNGVLDIGNNPATTKERAIAIIGLRKGGRSYYALDIHDPFNPTLKWSLLPDEADYLPQSRIASGGPTLANVKTILKNWGFSTCTPGTGRITFNGVLRDAVFLGGGASIPEVEAKFLDAYGDPTPLGRSVMALDVYTGEVLGAEDLSGQSGVGPVSTGLIPFEFFLNSGMAQRAYFLDAKGGLWSWGRNVFSTTAPYVDYRVDSPDVAAWSIRKVYQDGTGKNALYSTLPAPFRVGYFPGHGKDGAPPPAAVGIAIASGDRNNPLDFNYNVTTRPSYHRLTVVFDRQDHKVWNASDGPILDTDLMDAYPSGSSLQAGDPLITPGDNSYYLAPHDSNGVFSTPKLGWFRKFPAIGSDLFCPKGLNSPIVVAGSLFYSYFTPTSADRCTGGSGSTYTNLVCDVLNPIVNDSRTNLKCLSGNKFTWANLASDYVTIGTTGVLQGGVVLVANPTPGESKTTISLQTITGNVQERYPKPRVWRTVR